MQVHTLAKELGTSYREIKIAIKDFAEDMDIDLKRFRALSKLSKEQEDEIRLMFEKPEPVMEEVEKKPEKPRISWKPARLLDIPEHMKDPAFTYRWVDKDKPGNVRKKLSEGWEIDKKLTKRLNEGDMTSTIEDGRSIDGTMGIRELVVMRIPRELAEARNEFYQSRSETSTQDKDGELRGTIKGIGGETYGNIEERKGI
jgi:hypothetical protein